MNISKHISFSEATHSDKAIKLGLDNTPNTEQLNNMILVATICFEPIRLWYGKPIKINSFFRSEAVNKAVGGAKTSQHCKGEAIDLSAGSKEENKKIYEWIKENLQYDQVINEYDYTWVHISYKREGNRNQTLAIV